MINVGMVPVLNRHFRLQWEPAQKGYVLLYPEGMVKLNDTAAEILRECDGLRSIAGISKNLQQRYPDESSLQDDVGEFFATIAQKGWAHFV